MNSLPEHYANFLEKPFRLPSFLVAILPKERENLTVESITTQLMESGLSVKEVKKSEKPSIEAAEWQLDVTMEGNDLPTHALMKLPTIPLNEGFKYLPFVDDELVAKTRESKFSFGLETILEGHPLYAFHDQIKKICNLAPDALVFMDENAFVARDTERFHEIAKSKAPPSPAAMYNIHFVTKDNKPDSPVWMHTHGLRRCGLFEIELLSVPNESAELIYNILVTTAAMWMEKGMPPPDRSFAVGHGIEIVWLPWEEAIKTIKNEPGDSQDRNEPHNYPTACLFASKKKKKYYEKLSYFLPILTQHPVFFRSNAETQRMATLAEERFDIFRELFAKYGKEKDWDFVVKIGYLTDSDSGSGEHLWFEVQDIMEDSIEAILTNEPYDIKRMKKGDRGIHKLEGMSDFHIYCPFGAFNPESISILIKALEKEG
jgi:hypothetical protein